MKISCENCGTNHDLDPPSWVVSSGRAFRFRCSACGSSQSVQPAPEEPTEVPVERAVTPDPAPAAAEAAGSPEPSPTATPREIPSMAPPALLDEDDPSEPPVAAAPSVFLKQGGQIYSVRDWDTLKRWIGERRVDRTDLVSSEGVRWEPMDSRPELADLFDEGAPAPLAVPFDGDTPFGSGEGVELWSDDDTDGIPLGLPPLPTEDSVVNVTPVPLPSDLIFDPIDEDPIVEDPLDEDPIDEPSPLSGLDDAPAPDGLSLDDELVDPLGEATDERTPLDARRARHPPGLFDAETQQLPMAPQTAQDAGQDPRPARPAGRAPPRSKTPIPADPARQAGFKPPVPAGRAQPPKVVDAYPFDAEWEAELVGRQPGWWLLPAAAIVTGLAIFAAVAWIAFPPGRTPTPVPLERPAPDRVAADEATDQATDQTTDEATAAGVRDSGAPTERPRVPDPAPEPEPPPAPEPAPADISDLLAGGWKAAENDTSAAAAFFREALKRAPDDDDANYGYGYVMLMDNRTKEATAHLCRARNATDPETRQDVNGLIETHGLTCPGG